MRFSIVVPVYNVENYLAQCVDSIVSQKFDSYECILVDDGSTDSSGEMCDAFASAYASVRVIHKENGGLSSARNAGIKEANGDYLIFVDSDDFIMTDTFLSSLNNVANENHDLVRYQVLRYQTLEDEYTAVTAFNANRYIGLSPLDVLKSMIGDGTLNISAWCIAVRKGFLLENALYFKDGILSEDIEWGFRVFCCLPRWAFLSKDIYAYRQDNPNSITHNTSEKHLMDYLQIILDTEQLLYSCQAQLRDILMSYLMYHVLILIALLGKVDADNATKDSIDNALHGVCSRHIKESTLDKKVKLASVIYKVFGYKAMCYALRFYLTHR